MKAREVYLDRLINRSPPHSRAMTEDNTLNRKQRNEIIQAI